MSGRVTVFGGSGFVGRYVVERLADRGDVVTVAVRDPERAKYLRPLGDVGQVSPVRVDFGVEAAVKAAVSGADAVVNLVGILFESGRQTFRTCHVEGPALLARAADAAGVRSFIHVSAIGADQAAASNYARSKAAGEEAVRHAFPAATILRPSIVFGPEDGFFNRFAALSRFLPALPLYGGGHTRFQPVYVCDVADAIVAAIDTPAAAGQIYELGGPQTYSFADLMRVTLREIRRRRLLLPLPFAVGSVQAALFELLPNPPLTRDQLRQLRRDNVVAPGALGLSDLGVTPTGLETIVPTYLSRYRPGGRIGRMPVAA